MSLNKTLYGDFTPPEKWLSPTELYETLYVYYLRLRSTASLFNLIIKQDDAQATLIHSQFTGILAEMEVVLGINRGEDMKNVKEEG